MIVVEFKLEQVNKVRRGRVIGGTFGVGRYENGARRGWALPPDYDETEARLALVRLAHEHSHLLTFRAHTSGACADCQTSAPLAEMPRTYNTAPIRYCRTCYARRYGEWEASIARRALEQPARLEDGRQDCPET